MKTADSGGMEEKVAYAVIEAGLPPGVGFVLFMLASAFTGVGFLLVTGATALLQIFL